MSRSFGGGDTSGLMSGRGKSFFLHDLLAKVIFAEQGWVSYDRKAVRRSSVFRIAATSLMLLASAGVMGAWAYSYYNNRQLVESAEAALGDYELAASEDMKATEISDTDLLRVANHLQIPVSYTHLDVYKRQSGFSIR